MSAQKPDDILEVVYAAIEEVNGQLPPDQQLAKGPDTILIGDGGTLDSLGLINLVSAIEELLNLEMGVEVVLMDEELLAQENGPFRTVASLVKCIESHIDS